MIEKSIFSGIDGSINTDMFPDVDMDGTRIHKEKIIGIYKPSEELNYKNRKVIYQVVEYTLNRGNDGFIIVPGFRISENYKKEIGSDIEFGDRLKDGIKIIPIKGEQTVCDVELVSEKDKKQIREIINKQISKLYVNFW